MATARNNNNIKYIGVIVTLFLFLTGSSTDNQIRSHINKSRSINNEITIEKLVTKKDLARSVKIISIKLDAYNAIATSNKSDEVLNALNRNLDEIKKLEEILLYEE